MKHFEIYMTDNDESTSQDGLGFIGRHLMAAGNEEEDVFVEEVPVPLVCIQHMALQIINLQLPETIYLGGGHWIDTTPSDFQN